MEYSKIGFIFILFASLNVVYPTKLPCLLCQKKRKIDIFLKKEYLLYNIIRKKDYFKLLLL